MTAVVVPMKPQTTKALIDQTKAAWDRADQKKADADDWMIRTGKLLVELKTRVKDEGGQWLPVLKKLGRSQQRAHELMQLAGGEITIEEQRERNRTSKQKARTKKKSPGRPGEKRGQKDTSDPRAAYDQMLNPHDEYPEHEDQTEEFWQNAAANFFGEVIAREAYWDRQFKGWRDFELPSHVQTLMREAVTAFASLVKVIKT